MLSPAPRVPDAGRKHAFGRAGFTLVEVLVAVAILGISLLAIIVLRNECVADVHRVVDANDAWVLGTLALGAVQTAEILDEGADGGTFDEFPQYRWSVVKTPVEVDIAPEYFPGKERTAIPFKPKEILRIELVISLDDPPPDRPPELMRVVTYAQKRVPKP